MNYLNRLKLLYERVEQPFYKSIFFIICKRYQEYYFKQNTSKYVTKEELCEHLIKKGLMNYTINKVTNEEKLPDDRRVRQAVRILTKHGYPIISTSKEKGYCIADSTKQITQPMQENHKRALMCLSVEKGYNKMQEFILGQTDYLDTFLKDTNKNEYEV